VSARLGTDMLARTSVVSGCLLANEEIFPTNDSGSGAASRPMRRYNSLTSDVAAPLSG